ncbi:MAG: permease [Fidelibacterota bacterium]
MNSTAIIINSFAVAGLIISLIVNKRKTAQALKIALQSFFKILPQVLLIVVLIGLFMSFLTPSVISNLLGKQSGIFGILLTALLGAVMHIPSIVAFPLAASLLEKGAAVTTIATFIATLTMIGIVTFPLEIKELGKKFALWRNGLSFVFAILVGILMGVIL